MRCVRVRRFCVTSLPTYPNRKEHVTSLKILSLSSASVLLCCIKLSSSGTRQTFLSDVHVIEKVFFGRLSLFAFVFVCVLFVLAVFFFFCTLGTAPIHCMRLFCYYRLLSLLTLGIIFDTALD